MAETHQRPGAQSSIVEDIGKVLRTSHVFRHEPLQEHWIDLIKRFDAEEEAARAKGKQISWPAPWNDAEGKRPKHSSAL